MLTDQEIEEIVSRRVEAIQEMNPEDKKAIKDKLYKWGKKHVNKLVEKRRNRIKVTIPYDEYQNLLQKTDELERRVEYLGRIKRPEIVLRIIDDQSGELILHTVEHNMIEHEETTPLENRIRELVDNSIEKIRTGEQNLAELNKSLTRRWSNLARYLNRELKKLPWIVRIFVAPSKLIDISDKTEEEVSNE